VFSSLVIEVLKQKGVVQRAIFQTFDLECMEIGHRICPELTQSFLVDNNLTAEENFKLLSYQPPVFGPSYQQITNETMNYCTNNNIKVIPWTVNQPAAIQAMLQIGVAGMITDYPNRVLQALKTVEPS
jgi:glycerophosphoryl diester phosphodiesterase